MSGVSILLCATAGNTSDLAVAGFALPQLRSVLAVFSAFSPVRLQDHRKSKKPVTQESTGI